MQGGHVCMKTNYMLYLHATCDEEEEKTEMWRVLFSDG